jgi:hypothetical protein
MPVRGLAWRSCGCARTTSRAWPAASTVSKWWTAACSFRLISSRFKQDCKSDLLAGPYSPRSINVAPKLLYRLARVGHGLKRLVIVSSHGFVSLEALRWLADLDVSFVILR